MKFRVEKSWVKISDNIKLKQGQNLKAVQEKIKSNIDSAIAKINAGETKLTSGQIEAINSMNGIEVRSDIKSPFMNPANKVLT